MAYSKELWDKAKILYELGHSEREIEKITGISNGQINKKANAKNWKKEAQKKQLKSDIVGFEKKKEALNTEKEALIRKISTLEDFEITVIQDIVEQETERKSTLFSTATLSLIRKNQILTKNKKQSIEYETIYSDEGKPLKKTPIVIDMELSPIDLKTLDDGIDRNAITLELAPRHAPKTDIALTNAQQNNEQTIIQIVRDNGN